MKKKVAIVGFGELGRQFFDFIFIHKKCEFIFFDDILFSKKKKNVFCFNDFSLAKFNDYDFYVALGYHHLSQKLNIINKLLKEKKKLPSFTHPAGFINSTASIGVGNFIYPMCNIDKEVKIGNGVLLNNSVCISHNSNIGDCCYISPGVVISGCVEIGEKTFIGAGTVISNNIKIGKNVKVGAGTIVTHDIPDDCSAIGNPLKILEKEIELI